MFTFNTTKSIIAGAGAIEKIATLVKPILGARILLVTDQGLRKTGLLEAPIKALQKAGIALAIFDEVAADPPEENIMQGVMAAKAHNASGILGFGGGSPMDVAKVIALITASGERLDEAYGIGMAKGPRMPLVLVPTTAGTGSEVTPIAIITTGHAEKKGIVSPLLLPDLAILDATLTLGLPAAVTAATGIDAMVHAIESYASFAPNNNPISKALARQALQLLGANISEATHNGKNIAAREAMLLGSMLAGQAFANAPVAAVHALAYPLGGHFHIPHGLSNALVLPHVLRFNLSVAEEIYAEIACDAFPELAKTPLSQRGGAFVEKLSSLSKSLGLPQNLRDAGVPEDALPLLARDAMKQTRLLINNPRPMDEAEALAIYQAAFCSANFAYGNAYFIER